MSERTEGWFAENGCPVLPELLDTDTAEEQQLFGMRPDTAVRGATYAADNRDWQ